MKRKIDVFVKLVRLRLTSAFTLLIFAVRHEMFSKPLTFNPSTTQYCSKAWEGQAGQAVRLACIMLTSPRRAAPSLSLFQLARR